VRAIAGWSYERQGKVTEGGLAAVTADPAAFAGRIETQLTRLAQGRYGYSVQAEESRGNRGNVRKGTIVVSPQPAIGPEPCDPS
jgi:hypothetical protein